MGRERRVADAQSCVEALAASFALQTPSAWLTRQRKKSNSNKLVHTSNLCNLLVPTNDNQEVLTLRSNR